MTTAANAVPTLEVGRGASELALGRWIKMESFLTFSDADRGDELKSIRLDIPSGSGLGFYAANRGVLSAGQQYEMSSLSSLYIQGAKSYAHESVRVQVYDGIAWSEWSNVSLTSGRNSAPEIRELDSERAVTGELSTGIRTNERRRLSD